MSRFGNTQYGEAGYSTIKYGDSGLYSGAYISKPHTPAGPFMSSIDLTISMLLEDTRVENNDIESIYTETWTHQTGLTGPSGGTLSSSSDINADVEVAYIGQEITIHYTTTSIGGTASYQVVTDEATPTIIDADTINMYSGSTVHGNTLTISMPSLDAYKFIMTRESDTIYFDCLDVVCTNVEAYTRASTDLEDWTSWEYITNTSASVGTYTGVTPNYDGELYIQLRLELLSSVSTHSPEVLDYTLFTGDVGAFFTSGTWQSNNLTLAPNFNTLSHVTWTAITPGGTNVHIQTQANDGTDWESWSNPYVLGQDIARLADGFDSGTITTPYAIPEEIENSTFTWNNAKIYGYLPGADGVLGSFTHRDSGDVRLRWYIQNQIGNTVTDAHYIGQTIDMSTMSTLHNNQVRIRTELQRSADDNSPMVVWHALDTDVAYSETFEINEQTHPSARISSVFEDSTGERGVIDIPSVGFTIPSLVVNESYTITDMVNRDIVNIYWSDETTTTTDDQETVWAKSTGTKYYIYQTGIVYHGSPLYIDMPNATSFTPSIPSSDNNYAYRLIRGWGEDDTPSTPVTLHDNEAIILAWDSGGEDYETTALTTDSTPITYYPITEMAITNTGHTSNDIVVVSSLSEPYTEDTPWVSSVYVYSGEVNANYLAYQENYSQTVNLPPIFPVVVVDGDPYSIAFRNMGVRENGVTINEEDVNERFVTDDATPVSSLQLTPNVSTVTVTNEPIVRSNSEMDLIPVSMVQSITKISNTSGGTANYTQGVDYELLHNHVNWDIGGIEPAEGNTYYVDFTHHHIPNGHVVASSNYTHNIPTRIYWQSAIILKNYYNNQQNAQPVTCTPTQDYLSTALPDKDDNSVWTDLPNDLLDESVNYRIFNNNQLVSTYIEKQWSDEATPTEEYLIRATLGGRRPSRYWNPKIHDGYYYLNKQEHFLYVNPTTFNVPADGTVNAITNTLQLPYTPLKTSPITITHTTDEATPQTIVLRQVAFSREDDNAYTTYLTERITLDGSRDIRLAYYNIDPAFQITITDDDGINMFYIDLDPSDNIITLAEYGDGATPALEPLAIGKAYKLKDKKVNITYQPKDCFVVEYNTLSGNAVQFTFSEHYDNLDIYYESTDIHPSYLALEADLNPIRTSMTSGFLYVADQEQDVTYINIQMYPDQLLANGQSRAVISVDTLDYYGNPVVGSTHTVAVTDGSIVTYSDDDESPSLKQMLGRNVYTYTSPASIATATKTAKIIVTDEHNIAREYTFTLVRED